MTTAKKQSLNDFLYKKNRLQQIKGFYYAVRNEGISKAALASNLTQSTITLQIQSLERDLGFTLIERNRKTFALTKQGERFYKEACPLMQQFESVVENFLNTKKQEEQNKISIAVHHIAISCLMPKIISNFKKVYKDAEIMIHNIGPDEAMKRLKNDEIDMAFFPNLSKTPELELFEIMSYDPVLIMNKNHSLAKMDIKSFKDLEGQDLIKIDKGLITLPLFEEMTKNHGFKGSVRFENGNWEMLKHFIKHNDQMIAVISTLCLDKNDDDLAVKNLSLFFPKMSYSVATRKGNMPSKIMNDFTKEIERTTKYHDYRF